MDEYITRPEYDARIQRIDDENARQNKRIDKLESAFEKLSDLTASVQLLAQKMGDMKDELARQGDRLQTIEKEPAEKWRKLTWLIVTAVAGGVIGFLFSKLGM